MTEVNNPIVVVPYIFPQEIQKLKDALSWKIEVDFWQDTGYIGSDLAYQYLWNKHKDRDVIILHADMLPLPEDTQNSWYSDLLNVVNKYPEAGIFGMKLLYPQKTQQNQYIIQHAGGRFDNNGEAIHFGGGLNLYDGTANRKMEIDEGQYDKIREVAWVTMGGVYIKKTVRDTVGAFDPSFYWTYYRDVDWCLSARRAGYKIYQTGIPLLHFEGKDNKRLIAQNPNLAEKWNINRTIFMEKWQGTEEMKTIDREVEHA
jgi:GT2 family glycosyltransferase